MPRRIVAAALGLALVLLDHASAGTLSPRIVNGVLTHAYPSTGALLLGSDPDSAALLCSGTMIGCDTFLTAAHCVCELDGPACQLGGLLPPDPSELVVFLQHAGFFAVSSVAVEPTYLFPDNDIAVLKLATPVTGISPSPLPSQKPPFGTSGTIVGFGRTGGAGVADFGLKQQGRVVTESCSGSISNTRSICWSYAAPIGPPGTDSNTCNGDSGGPLFVAEGPDLVVAGVTSGGDAPECLDPDNSWDTNVHHYLSFVQSRGGADLQNQSCGAISQVGDADTSVHGFSGLLDGVTPSRTHSFSVGSGAEALRVSMNADETGSNDFDLYVRFGTPPTLAQYDCRAFGGNNYGFCEFPSPAEGTWYAMVNLFSGDGTYQATATIFGQSEEPPPPPLPEGAQTEPQRQCIESMQKGGQKVARAAAKDASSCVAAFAKGQARKLGAAGQTQTAQACLTNDVKGRVIGAEAKTMKKDARKCLASAEQLPDYAYTGSGPVNAVADASYQDLVADVFGSDLDAALASEAADREGARCQAEIVKRVRKVYDATWKAAFKTTRKALAGSGGFAMVTSDAELGAAVDATLQVDPKGKIGRARAKLLQGAARRCFAPLTPLTALFPGACVASDVNALADCAGRQAVCRACEAARDSSGLALDCDLADDGLANASCS